MKSTPALFKIILPLLGRGKEMIPLAALLLLGFAGTARAQGTTFTYQGRLNDGASPATGIYDLRFAIYDSANSPANIIAGPVTNSATGVSNGLFTAALDFGSGVFTGDARWLDIGVRTNGGGAFTGLTPRQALTPAPYAVFAASAGNVPGLVMQANTNGAPNVIAGSPVNFVSSGVVGATIGGGGATNYYYYAYTNSVTADFGTVGGGIHNTASYFATVGGGWHNTASGQCATVGGGYTNTARGDDATVGGGAYNSASWGYGTVGGGYGNAASNYCATVGGGAANTAGGQYATVGGGSYNTAGGQEATVGGGYINQATNNYATVPGGYMNLAGGAYSLAAGRNARATNNGAFVWSDGTGTTTYSTGTNQFVARASGGFLLYSSTGNAGVSLAPGGGSWSSLSDRNVKQDFAPVDPQAVLAQVAALPLTTWSYRTEPGVRHVGPMAQDFYAAFGVGEDDKHITEVDQGGVALAAIQGLNEKLEAQRAENTELRARLEKLERLLNAKNRGGQ